MIVLLNASIGILISAIVLISLVCLCAVWEVTVLLYKCRFFVD